MAAVYPVTGDFAAGNLATTDSYSGQFIPQLWSGKLLAKFYQNTAGGFWMQKSDLFTAGTDPRGLVDQLYVFCFKLFKG